MNSPYNNIGRVYFNKHIQKAGDYCRKIGFPGAKGLSFYDVISIYIKGLLKGSLNIRATSIAFHFLLALGPAIIFLLGLIAYIPFPSFKVSLMDVLIDIIPENSYQVLESLLDEVFDKHHGLQIFGFVVTLFFLQKGLNGIIEAFDATYHSVNARSWYERRLVSIFLLLIFFILVILAALLLFFSSMLVKHLYATGVIRAHLTITLLLVGKWTVVLALTFMVISFLYFMAPAHKTKWRLFSPGSVFATILSIFISMTVSYFINHFAPLNRFYGSVGTLIAVMLWLNFNAIALLAGFELNVSIKNARLSKLEPSVI